MSCRVEQERAGRQADDWTGPFRKRATIKNDHRRHTEERLYLELLNCCFHSFLLVNACRQMDDSPATRGIFGQSRVEERESELNAPTKPLWLNQGADRDKYTSLN